MTLFDKYGGIPTVTSIVRAFYKDVLVNPRLKPYFADVATEKLIQHQIIFVSQLLGKPVSEKLNSDHVMKKAHTGQRVSESAFFEVIDILKNVLVVHHMEEADIASVMALIGGFKNAIVELPTFTRTAQ
jgi:truncated hemoglobin YjbI